MVQPGIQDTPNTPADPAPDAPAAGGMTPEQVAELEQLRAQAPEAREAMQNMALLQQRLTAAQQAGDPGAAEAIRILSGQIQRQQAAAAAAAATPPAAAPELTPPPGLDSADDYALQIANAARAAATQDAVKAVMETIAPELAALRTAIQQDRTQQQQRDLVAGDDLMSQRAREQKNDFDAWLARNPQWGQVDPAIAFSHYDYQNLLRERAEQLEAQNFEQQRRQRIAGMAGGIPAGQGNPGSASPPERLKPNPGETPNQFFKRIAAQNRHILENPY